MLSIRALRPPPTLLLLLCACGSGAGSTGPARDAPPVTTGAWTSLAEGPGETPPLLLVRPAPATEGGWVRPLLRVPRRAGVGAPAEAEANEPSAPVTPAEPIRFTSTFVGLGSELPGFTVRAVPPDTIGAVGPGHYVQLVNGGMAVFQKTTGQLLLGPIQLSSLFTSLPNLCATTDWGDPYVLYDQLADRWVVSQFAFNFVAPSTRNPPYLECVAVSRTGDPTGAWWAYSFEYPAFNDYPKLALWPDGYYVTYNMFTATDAFLHGTICAFDRVRMLDGLPATQQCFDVPDGGLLVSSLTGPTPPPAGSPAYVFTLATNVSLALWNLRIDWTAPGSSTLTGPTSLAVPRFELPCGGSAGQCVTQPGVPQVLDTLGDRPMTPLAYRNLGDHESLIVNHTVASGSSTGVRWYEIRNPRTTPTVFQRGTVAPDAAYRWMGSMAMDRAGNVALGYSVSSAELDVKPSIAVSGRLASDPPGTMPLVGTLFAGPGVQYSAARALGRWGDYSSMTVDPIDDCTFYYANQYQPADGIFNWSTRVGYFSFPSCLSTADFTLSASPTSLPVIQGGSGTSTVTTTQVGSAGTVSLQAAVSPAGAGVTAILDPPSVAAGGSSTLTVSASAGATPGSYTVTVTGTEGAAVHSTAVSVTVPTPPDFAISASPTSLPLTQGGSGTSTVTTTQVGSAGTVSLQTAVSPAGAGVTALLDPPSVAAGGSSTLTVSASADATPGSYTVTVTGTEGAAVHSTAVSATVPPADFTLTTPAALPVTQGTSGTGTVSTTRVGSAGTVALEAAVSPAAAGVTATLNPTSVSAGGSSTLTVSASADATPGSYTVTVTGTEGSLTHASPVTVTVSAPAPAPAPAPGGGGCSTSGGATASLIPLLLLLLPRGRRAAPTARRPRERESGRYWIERSSVALGGTTTPRRM